METITFENWEPGVYKKMFGYSCFIPTTVNHQWSWSDPRIHCLLEEAAGKLAQLNALSRDLPDVHWFIRMHVNVEANASSRIEGTRTEIEDLILKPEDVSEAKRDDRMEVTNYIKAMNQAIEQLNTLPLSNRLLRDAHRTLLEGVRGDRKTPGEFRLSQNWIGGSTLSNAHYIPPEALVVPELMSDLELFWHNREIHVPHLVRIALSHYQFESIHPFLDGNGRIGRLLIPLYMIANEQLDKPTLYLSQHIERHRDDYYDALQRPRKSGDIGSWVAWFLEAVAVASANGIERIKKILKLHAQTQAEVMRKMGRTAENGDKLLQFLFSNPLVSVRQVAELISTGYNPANRLVQQFVDANILKQWGNSERNRYFVFYEYLRLFKE